MINFIDEEGKQYSAIVECKKTKGVNGEKSLNGTIYTNDEILEGIGRGWRLQFEDENYCLTYVNPIDEGTRIVVEFDAVHEFFFDLSKSVVYTELNGSNTAKAYLDFIFNGSGYSYNLEVTIPAFEKESFGMKNRLDLFKDFVSSTGVEFSVSGKIVRILEKVGSNLSTIVKKGFNLNELRIEKNIGNFITYLKGYGAYNDPEDQTKGRLEVEYLSPLASIYGKLEGDPIVDERYKNTTSLTTRLKNEIESSYGVSVDIDMEDLTKAGYEYDQPHEGDYIMAINKDLGFEQKIRIMSYTTSYDTEGNIIDHDVSCGSDNLVSQATKSDNDFRKNVQAGLENAVNTANQAWISADGKNKVFTGTDEPVATNKGDIWYQVDGEKTIMKFWNGYEWQAFIDPKAVQQAADEAKAAGEEAKQAGEEAKVAGAAAQVSAEEAKALGAAAKQAGEEAKVLGNEALEAGQNAVAKATTADSNASTALANANSAVDKATQASQKADNSATTANEAKTQAANAVTNANTALTNARNAINQVTQLNSDLEDTNGQVSTITDNLNGFKQTVYTKTQTDTKIATVQSDVNGFKTSVSNTYATKSEIQGIKAGVRNYICEVAWTTKGYLATNGSVTNSNDNRVSGFIDIDASKVWIFQQFESPTSGSVYVAFYDTNKSLIGSRLTLSDGQTGTTANNAVYMRLSTPYKDTFGGRYKFEFGTVKSDWTQAPEDTQFIYTNLQTQVDQTANAVSAKADKTTVDQISGRVDTAEGNITTMAGQIKLKANQSTVDTITNRVNATEASLTLQDGKITTLTTKTDDLDTSLTSLTQDYNGFKGTVYTKSQTDTKITTVQATVDTFKTTVASTYSSKTETDSKVANVQANVDKLGTNIAYAWSADGKDRFSKIPYNQNEWSNTKKDDYTTKTISSGDVFYYFPYSNINNFKGKKATISAYLKSGSTSKVFVQIWFNSPTKGSILTKGNPVSEGISKVTVDIPADITAFNMTIANETQVSAATSVQYKMDKLEFGEYTPWTPKSTEDYDNAIPRYIGRSLKDSTNPDDYKFEVNPDRRPWTGYMQALDGTDFSKIPYNTNLWSNTSRYSYKKVTISSADVFYYFPLPNKELYAGKTVTISAYLKPTVGYAYIQCWYRSPSIPGKIEKGQYIYAGSEGLSSATFYLPADVASYNFVIMNSEVVTKETSIEYKAAKLEVGRYTPWTPNPNDSDQAPLLAIPKYIGYAPLPSDNWSDYTWNLSSEWNEVKSSTSIEQTNNAITLKADKTTLNEVTGRVTANEGKITLLSDRMNFRITNSDGSITQIDLANKVISLSGEQVNITGNTYIANGVIKEAAIADLAVSTAKIANLAVSEGKIDNLAVTNAKIASLAVDEAKIANLAVTNAKKGSLAVNNAKIADLAVTNAKIANLAVSTAKIADLAVTNAKIGSISADKINVGTLNAANVNIINLNANNITSGTITGININASTFYGTSASGTMQLNSSDLRFNTSSNSFRLDYTGINNFNSQYGNRTIGFYDEGIYIRSAAENSSYGSPNYLNSGIELYGRMSYIDFHNAPDDTSDYKARIIYNMTGQENNLFIKSNSGLVMESGAAGINVGTNVILRTNGTVQAKSTDQQTWRAFEGSVFSQRSTHSSKQDFEEINTRDLLKAVVDTDIVKYHFKDEVNRGKAENYIGFIINDDGTSPYNTSELFINRNKTGFNTTTAVGILAGAIKELYQEIEALKAKVA